MVRSNTAAPPTVRITPLCAAVLNPARSARTSYCPGPRLVKLYRPSLSVVASRVAPVLAFLAVIFTLGTRAPDASLTTPESVAVGVCPNATTLASSAVRAASNKPFLLVINRCSFKVGLGPCAICHMKYGIWRMVDCHPPSKRQLMQSINEKTKQELKYGN